MITAYSHPTRIGRFIIKPHHGNWRILFDDELLGRNYLSAQHALDDLAGGHCDWPDGIGPSTLGLSDDVGEWGAVSK